MYKRQTGIALSDTYTSGIFLSNLSRKQAKLFEMCIRDSGKPIVLFFFECMVIESAGIPGQFVCKRRKQEILSLIHIYFFL